MSTNPIFAVAQDTALRMLTSYGGPATLKHKSTGSYDTTTGTAPITSTSESVLAMLLGSTEDIEKRTDFVVGEQRILLAATGVVSPPLVGDSVIIDTVEWSVIEVSNVAPGGVDILYDMRVIH